jgi:hypothetical protein
MANFEQDNRQNDGKYERFLTTEADMPEPSADLHGRIMRRVKRYERRVLVAKTIGFGALFAASAATVVAAYFNLMSAAAQSGFFQFVSLFFSDFGAAMANFQDFAFSIIESFPVFSAAFLLAGVIAVIWSAAHFIDDIAQMRGRGGLVIG